MTHVPHEPESQWMISEEGAYGMALDAAWEANKAWDTMHDTQAILAEMEDIKGRHLPGVIIDDREIERLQSEHEVVEKEFPEYLVVAGSLLRQPTSTARKEANAGEQDDEGNEILGITPKLQYYLDRPVSELLADQAAPEEQPVAVQLGRTLHRNKIFDTRAMLLRGLDHEGGISKIRTAGSKQIKFAKKAVAKLDSAFEWSDAPNGIRAAQLYTSLENIPADVLRYQEGRHELGLDFGDFTIAEISNATLSTVKSVIKRGNYTSAQLTELARALKNAANTFKTEFTTERETILETHASQSASTKK